MVGVFPGDIWLSQVFQSMGDWFMPIMSFFTWLGYPQAYMIAVAIIYWSIDRKMGLRLAIFLPLVASLNSILKQAFHAPRPFWIDPDIKAIRISNGFGMPSGHAQASVVWLYAAMHIRRRWFWITAIAAAVLIGISRIYLGVHFSSQVVAGWLTGIVVLVLFSSYESRVLAWFLSRKFSGQLLVISGITAGSFMLGALILFFTRDWEVPADWIENAALYLEARDESILSSRGLSAVAGNCGGFLGVALGALLAHRKGGFEQGRSGWQRVGRSAAGLLLLTAIYLLFSWISPDQDKETLAACWQFSGFFVISFFVIFLYPFACEKIRPLS
jgi:membrane-associated phospholipid phosphatase